MMKQQLMDIQHVMIAESKLVVEEESPILSVHLLEEDDTVWYVCDGMRKNKKYCSKYDNFVGIYGSLRHNHSNISFLYHSQDHFTFVRSGVDPLFNRRRCGNGELLCLFSNAKRQTKRIVIDANSFCPESYNSFSYATTPTSLSNGTAAVAKPVSRRLVSEVKQRPALGETVYIHRATSCFLVFFYPFISLF